MSTLSRRCAPVMLWLTLCWLALIAGCANFYARPEGTSQAYLQRHWQGRLAVTVESDPIQAFSANFSLEGSPTEGTLALTSVIGTRLATMHWSARTATLQTSKELLHFDSVDALLTQALGAPLPLPALFGWLRGDATAPPGWEVDLKDRPIGRIRARRLSPDAAADIKIIVEPG